jgi:hypothetical protein
MVIAVFRLKPGVPIFPSRPALPTTELHAKSMPSPDFRQHIEKERKKQGV